MRSFKVKMSRYILAIGILFMVLTDVYGQSDSSINKDSSAIGEEFVIPPLDSLYVWAEMNSPQLRQQEALIAKTAADTKRVRKHWMDAIKVAGDYRSGNYGNSVINQVQTGYSIGPYVSFSFYELASNKDLVNVYKAEEAVAKAKLAQASLELMRQVTILYNELQMEKRILIIRSNAVHAAYVHQIMAETEFRQGSIAIGELSRVTEIHAKAQTDLELSINSLRSNYALLQMLCGRDFNTIN